jgi:tyrosyl-tRNA synthetase
LKDPSARGLIDAFKDGSDFLRVSRDRVLGMGVVDVAVETGVCKSRSAGRKMVKDGGLYIVSGGKADKVQAGMTVGMSMVIEERVLLLRTGKTRYKVVELV